VSHGEIWALAERNNWQSKKRDALEKMLDRLVTVDLNANEIIKAYVEVDKLNQAAQKGARQVSNNDMWIAATARASSASLLTTDQDFLHLHPHYLFVEYIHPGSKLASATAGSRPKIQ
jgi:predicted nucleic acid-binding protein